MATKSVVLTGDGESGYGDQRWVLAGAFDGVYEARGRSGQAIIVWPDKDLVAVFTGRGLDVRGEVAPLLVAALQSDSALEANPEAFGRLNEAICNATEPPPAKPVHAVSPLATAISGTVYRLDENQFGVRCMSLRFDAPSEIWFDLTLGSDAFELPVGMDGVHRFSETGPTGIAIGILGQWTEPTVFSMEYDELGGPNHLRIRGDFGASAESVSLAFSEPGEYFPPQLVQGALVSSCDGEHHQLPAEAVPSSNAATALRRATGTVTFSRLFGSTHTLVTLAFASVSFRSLRITNELVKLDVPNREIRVSM